MGFDSLNRMANIEHQRRIGSLAKRDKGGRMDPQGRFTDEYQALHYLRERADELAAAYGQADEPRGKLTETLVATVRNRLTCLAKSFRPAPATTLINRELSERNGIEHDIQLVSHRARHSSI